MTARARACGQIPTGAMLQLVLCRLCADFEGQIRQLIRTKTAVKAPDSGLRRNDEQDTHTPRAGVGDRHLSDTAGVKCPHAPGRGGRLSPVRYRRRKMPTRPGPGLVCGRGRGCCRFRCWGRGGQAGAPGEEEADAAGVVAGRQGQEGDFVGALPVVHIAGEGAGNQ